jgi:hypothetical protein
MTRRGSSLLLIAAAAISLAGPVTGAQASAKGIKNAIKSLNGKVLTAEGHVVSAEGTYSTTKEPAPVIAAIEESVKVLGEMRTAVEHQSAGRPKIKKAKRLVIAGLSGVMTAYGRLKTAFSEKATDEAAANVEAAKAVTAVKAAKKDLRKGLELLR